MVIFSSEKHSFCGGKSNDIKGCDGGRAVIEDPHPVQASPSVWSMDYLGSCPQVHWLVLILSLCGI